jgi:hypothetical protein
MHARTEDLLKIRDGEPVEAALRERVLACPQCSRELERLRRMRNALAELPELEPPAGVWKRVIADVTDDRSERRAGLDWRRWPAGVAAAAAVVAAVAVALLAQAPRSPPPAPESLSSGALNDTAIATAPRAPAAPARSAAETEAPEDGLVAGAPLWAALQADGVGAAPGTPRWSRWVELPPDYAGLVAESAQLEQLLADLPRQRRLMTADTAATLAALEDRITWLDEQLTLAAGRDVDPRQRQALWSERVEVMNALVQVRYAQAW